MKTYGRVEAQFHAPAALSPGTNWTEGWLGPKGDLDTVTPPVNRTPVAQSTVYSLH